MYTPYVGEAVRIREWGDMEAEFGLTRGGNINCNIGFNVYMKELCGNVFNVSSVDGSIVSGHETHWTITTDMIEPADEKDVDVGDLVGFLDEIKIG